MEPKAELNTLTATAMLKLGSRYVSKMRYGLYINNVGKTTNNIAPKGEHTTSISKMAVFKFNHNVSLQ